MDVFHKKTDDYNMSYIFLEKGRLSLKNFISAKIFVRPLKISSQFWKEITKFGIFLQNWSFLASNLNFVPKWPILHQKRSFSRDLFHRSSLVNIILHILRIDHFWISKTVDLAGNFRKKKTFHIKFSFSREMQHIETHAKIAFSTEFETQLFRLKICHDGYIDVGDEIYWWQFWDDSDGIRHQHPLSLNISVGHQHPKDVIQI